jgi:nickel-dependent lactate racemase
MLVELPYGKGFVKVEIPNQGKIVYPRDLRGVSDVKFEIRRAMDHPIGCMPLRQLASRKSDALVVINDLTRPTPTEIMIEEILADLTAAGIREHAVSVLIACGNHRPNTMQEIEQMLGSGLSTRLRIANHFCQDEKNLTHMGETDTGLPIWVNSLVARASLKILTGLITPHQGAGYTGGRKSLIPGVAGLSTLNRHHSFPIRPYQPASGWMKGNPFHEEAVKGARMVGVDFIVNVVKNSKGEVVKAVAGELEAAHEQGVMTCEESWVTEVQRKYDIVIVSPGGYPRDINLHQSQKAMSAAETVIEENGIIVLIAECLEGTGESTEWLKLAKTPRDVIERFKREGYTREGSSKAFMCARALEKHTVIVSCSGIEKSELEQMFFRYAPSPQAAIAQALKLKGRYSSLLVMPYAGSCIVRVDGGYELNNGVNNEVKKQ